MYDARRFGICLCTVGFGDECFARFSLYKDVEDFRKDYVECSVDNYQK